MNNNQADKYPHRSSFKETILKGSLFLFMLLSGTSLMGQNKGKALENRNAIKFGFFRIGHVSVSPFTISYEREGFRNFSISGTLGFNRNGTSKSHPTVYGLIPARRTTFMGMLHPRYYFLLNKKRRLEGIYVSVYGLYIQTNFTDYQDYLHPDKWAKTTQPEFGFGLGFQYTIWKCLNFSGELLNGYHFKKIEYFNFGFPAGIPWKLDLGGFGFLRFHLQVGVKF